MPHSKTSLQLILLLALPLAAQTGADKTAGLQGTVTNSVSGLPIPRAHIMLQGSNDGRPVRYGATSGPDGNFSLSGVAPGSYSAEGQRIGFVESSANRTKVTLEAGDNKSGIEIRLIPTGAITGRVTDSDGDPVEGVSVSTEGGGNGAPTDEKGQFRIGGLAPGKYSVKASHGEMFDGRPEIRTDGTVEVHDATTYYPGVMTEKEAGKVRVRAGDETAGVNIKLVAVPFVRVSGRVVDFPANAAQAFVMVSQNQSGNGSQLKRDGTFTLWHLEPGKYNLIGQWETPGGQNVRTVGVEIEITGSNIDNIELRVVADSDIPGQLEFEDDSARQIHHGDTPDPDAPKPTVSLTAVGSFDDMDISSPIDSAGVFHLKRVPAAKYRVSVSWGTSYVKSMRLGTTTTEGTLLDLRNGSAGSDLSLLMSAATGSISGTVQVDHGSPAGTLVILAPAEEGMNFESQITTKADGTYAFTGLAPGSYKLVALSQEDRDSGYEDQMESIEVGPKEKVTKDLKRRVLADP